MRRRVGYHLLVGAFVFGISAASAGAAVIGPSLAAKLQTASGSATVGTVIVAFNTTNGLNAAHLIALTQAGVTKAFTLQNLGMAAFPATAAQVQALANNSAVRSIYANDRLYYFNDQTRTLTGTDRMRTDPGFIQANHGLPVSGKGIGLVINDSGIDGTHPDLQYPAHTVQNTQIVTDTSTLAGFTPLLFVEGVPDTDLNVGHGTHCAGIAAGTGAASGGQYAGVAPGANLIGAGSGAVLFILNGLGGFEYALTNQFRYNIRVISNSWGGNGPFDANDPVSIASQELHDRNITVVFAAGNSGPGRNTMNPYAKSPYVIAVAAGTKEGGLASFSSRGTPKAERPADSYDAPTITAPGTGREFASDSAKFTSDVVSTRSKTNVFANGETADAELAPAVIPYYTEISGTSMATPFVAGTVALISEADPTLTPDQIKSILQQTASQMPGYSEYEVGAGYINVYAAIDKVFHRTKNYGLYSGALDVRNYNETMTVSGPAPANFTINYSPAATPGPGSPNSTTFQVAAGTDIVDVYATFDTAAAQDTGNTIGIVLTDPAGHTYSSGLALPILDSPSREVKVMNPATGTWLLEVRGVRGLTALPNMSLPTSGLAAPGPVNITLALSTITLKPVPDIQNHPARAEIERALKNRQMDTLPDGTFRPNSNVTRADFAGLLVLNTPLRQYLRATREFFDVSGVTEAIAEAVTANGSNLRDYNFTPTGMMGISPSTFGPTNVVKHVELAVALVKALGLDAEAQALAGTDVTVTYSGQTLTLTDESLIPAALRGYVQIALNKGILQAVFTLTQGPYDPQPTVSAAVKPNDPETRASMAYALDHYRAYFAVGN